MVVDLTLLHLKNGVYNKTHFTEEEFDKMYSESIFNQFEVVTF